MGLLSTHLQLNPGAGVGFCSSGSTGQADEDGDQPRPDQVTVRLKIRFKPLTTPPQLACSRTHAARWQESSLTALRGTQPGSTPVSRRPLLSIVRSRRERKSAGGAKVSHGGPRGPASRKGLSQS